MTGGHKLVCLAMAVPAIPAQSQRAIVRPPGPVVTFRLRRSVASAEPGVMDTPLQERTEAIFCQLEGRSALEAYVTFHDDMPFTAADVVFSIERARAETSDLPTLVGGS
jgi:hypothetical protein